MVVHLELPGPSRSRPKTRPHAIGNLHRYNPSDTLGHTLSRTQSGGRPKCLILSRLEKKSRDFFGGHFLRDTWGLASWRSRNAPSLTLPNGRIHQIFTQFSANGKMASLGVLRFRHFAKALQAAFRAFFPE